MTTLVAHAAAVGLALQSDRKILMIERGIGYWIAPDGQCVPVPPGVMNADMIRELINPSALNEDEQDRFTTDANAFAIEQGWTRVRIYPADRVVYADLGVGKGSEHRKLVDDMLDRMSLTGFKVKVTDEEGNYTSS
ncbi:MAG: hypothetical protein WD768_09760 [Phycisphaeraceae bacterium]